MEEEPILLEQSYIELDKTVMVIAYNIDDFHNWCLKNKLNKSFLRSFNIKDVRYIGITRMQELRGYGIDEIMETDRAKENREYNSIINLLRYHFNSRSQHKIKKYFKDFY